MQGTLVLTILTVQSSYIQEMEEPLDDSRAPDTIQWWIAPTGSWRIRTYAIDHDIHTHSVGNADNLRELALENAQKHYGDVIQSQHVIELTDCLDRNETGRFARQDWSPALRLPRAGLPFGNQMKGAIILSLSPGDNGPFGREVVANSKNHPSAKRRGPSSHVPRISTGIVQ